MVLLPCPWDFLAVKKNFLVLSCPTSISSFFLSVTVPKPKDMEESGKSFMFEGDMSLPADLEVAGTGTSHTTPASNIPSVSLLSLASNIPPVSRLASNVPPVSLVSQFLALNYVPPVSRLASNVSPSPADACRHSAEEAFVEEVQRRRCLWDTSAVEYRDMLMKERARAIVAVSEAAKALNLTDARACKAKFKNVRDTYMRHKKGHAAKQPRSGSGAVCIPDPSWPLWACMQFLRHTVRHRQTTSNVAIVDNVEHDVSNYTLPSDPPYLPPSSPLEPAPIDVLQSDDAAASPVLVPSPVEPLPSHNETVQCTTSSPVISDVQRPGKRRRQLDEGMESRLLGSAEPLPSRNEIVQRTTSSPVISDVQRPGKRRRQLTRGVSRDSQDWQSHSLPATKSSNAPPVVL
ncbi:uncharacterized protein LOC135825156 [Sycon ciliatum]|uniref:uncharacterized protein LOC135825156 n=1 Tax=Sycon ciliatum TaxID=27933 RepID=UPI0031F60921